MALPVSSTLPPPKPMTRSQPDFPRALRAQAGHLGGRLAGHREVDGADLLLRQQLAQRLGARSRAPVTSRARRPIAFAAGPASRRVPGSEDDARGRGELEARSLGGVAGHLPIPNPGRRGRRYRTWCCCAARPSSRPPCRARSGSGPSPCAGRDRPASGRPRTSTKRVGSSDCWITSKRATPGSCTLFEAFSSVASRNASTNSGLTCTCTWTTSISVTPLFWIAIRRRRSYHPAAVIGWP